MFNYIYYIYIYIYIYICIYTHICTYVCVYVSVFLDCPKMYFQDLQKTHFFRYFLQILKIGPEDFGQVVILL